MNDLVLLHRKTNKNLLTPWSKFSTCLRQIVFFPQGLMGNHFNLEPEDEIFKEEHALAFLIEVLCGLHSPVFGETEVLGQFKKFYEDEIHNLKGTLYQHQKWIQFVFQEVKRLRTQYLMNMRSHSYGSLLRRHLKNESRVMIFGSGQLSLEIAPWLYDHKKVTIVCRHLDKAYLQWQDHLDKIQIETYKNLKQVGDEVVIIAAPLEDHQILSYIKRTDQEPRLVFDLRGEENQLFQVIKNRISLKELFDELKYLQLQNENILVTLKKLIQKNSRDFILRSEFHPLGWDDLCS